MSLVSSRPGYVSSFSQWTVRSCSAKAGSTCCGSEIPCLALLPQPALHQAPLALGTAPTSLIWGWRLKLSESGCLTLPRPHRTQTEDIEILCRLIVSIEAKMPHMRVYLSALDDHVPCPTPSAVLFLVPLEALVDHWEQPIKPRVLCSLNPNYTPGNLSQCVFRIELRLSDIMQLFIM